jgi:hypothetical protein
MMTPVCGYWFAQLLDCALACAQMRFLPLAVVDISQDDI